MATRIRKNRTKAKTKRVRAPRMVQQHDDDGVAFRAMIFMLAVIVIGGLAYTYHNKPEFLAFLPTSGKVLIEPSTTGTAPTF